MPGAYRLDGSWQRFGAVVLAGSPLRLFRTSPAGSAVLDALECGASVAPSRLVERLLDAGAIHPPPASGEHRDTHRDTNGDTRRDTRRYNVADVTVVTPQLRTDAASRVPDDGRITIDDGSQPPLDGATLRLPINLGPGGARNAARPLIATPLVAFLDADVDASSTWLEPLIGHFDDPAVGLVAPRVRGEAGSPLDLGEEPARIRAGTRVSYVPGAALVVRVDAFDAIGGFDPTLRFGEDVDLVWRLDDAGWTCRYEPTSVVWHRPRPTFAGRLRQHAGYGTSAAPLARRHPGALAPVRCNGWTAAVWVAIASGHPVVGVVTAVASAVALPRKLPGVPPRRAIALAVRGHLLAGRQMASAVRRVWWPLVLVAALMSKRARWVAVASVVTDALATPNDVAYGWGVWAGMRRHRTLAPVVPQLSAWPGRQRTLREPRRPLDGGVR